MPRDGNIMAEAYRQFQADKARRQAQLDQRTAEVYLRVPAIAAIDRRLQSTAAQIVLAAFESESEPEEALKKLAENNLALQQERVDCLVEAGYPRDYLDETPVCGVCGDTGYLPGGKPCKCLMAYYTREQNRRLSKLMDLENQSFAAFSLEWYPEKVWPEYGVSPRENMRMVRGLCERYARNFPQGSSNLLFTGAPGLGKTFLSACIAREVSGRGFSVVYDTAAHVLQQFEMRKFGREDPYEEDPEQDVNRYLNCDLLMMDDLGTEMNLPSSQSLVYQIVNDRLVNGRKTVLSTNLRLDDMGRRYGEAVLSRIRGEYQIIRFFGQDIRQLKRNR
ncbi:MAG: ATP-binding protein [Oscillibacter sp.]|nr:ATP-binding protein [Oscillibacter sp.]